MPQVGMLAGQEVCRTEWILVKSDVGQEGFSLGEIKDRKDAGQEGCRTGGMQDRKDAGQETNGRTRVQLVQLSSNHTVQCHKMT